MRHGEPGRCCHAGKVDQAHEESEHITAHDAEEDGDDGQETFKGNGTDDGNGQGKHGNSHVVHIYLVSGETGHSCSRRRQFQADDGDDGAHSGRREDHVDPLGAGYFNNEGKENEQEAEDDEASLGIRVRMAG